jgi:WD40 repeat protein
VFVWDVAGGKPVEVTPPDRRVLAVSPDGQTALAAKHTQNLHEPSTVGVWNLTTGKPVGEETRLNVPIRCAVCGGDGKTFAGIGDASLGSARLFLWDAATGKHTDFSLGFEVNQAALSPEGKVLAVVNGSALGPGRTGGMPAFWPARPADKATVRLFDLAARAELPPLPDNQVAAEAAVAVGPAGRLVLTVSPTEYLHRGGVHLWDREAKTHRDLPHQHLDLPDLTVQSQGRVALAQFSPDGKVLLTASGRGPANDSEEVRLWETTTGRPLGAPLLPRGPVQTAAFSPDSKVVAVGCGAGEVQLWETATGPLGRPLRHPGPVFAVAFSPDGSKLVTGGYDGTARVWDTVRKTGIQPARWFEQVVANGAGRCLQREKANTVRLHDLASGRPWGEPIPYTDKDRAIALGPDERTVVVVNEGTTARLWDAATGKPIGEPLETIQPVTAVRFGPDGKTLLTFMQSELAMSVIPFALRWDTATGLSLGGETNPHVTMALATSPDGRRALRAKGPVAVLVDVAAMANHGKVPAGPVPSAGLLAGGLWAVEHPGPVTGGLFSPDGRTLLTTAARSGSWYEARLWDAATGKPLGPPMPHQGPIRAKLFSPDGKTLLTGSDDGTARLWDAATGTPLGPPLTHGGRVRAVAFRPEGKLAATAGDDGTVRLWHLATGKPVGPPLLHPAAVSFVTFGTGGETLITAAADRVGIWKVPQALPGPASRLLLEAEIETGMELDGSTPRLLDDAERTRRGQRLEAGDKAPRAEGGR